MITKWIAGLMVPSWVKKGLMWVALAAAAVWTAVSYGRREERRKEDIARLKASVKAVKDRKEIDDEIADDTDLVARARRVGVVHEPKQ